MSQSIPRLVCDKCRRPLPQNGSGWIPTGPPVPAAAPVYAYYTKGECYPRCGTVEGGDVPPCEEEPTTGLPEYKLDVLMFQAVQKYWLNEETLALLVGIDPRCSLEISDSLHRLKRRGAVERHEEGVWRRVGKRESLITEGETTDDEGKG